MTRFLHGAMEQIWLVRLFSSSSEAAQLQITVYKVYFFKKSHVSLLGIALGFVIDFISINPGLTQFVHFIFLWFEGKKPFNTVPKCLVPRCSHLLHIEFRLFFLITFFVLLEGAFWPKTLTSFVVLCPSVRQFDGISIFIHEHSLTTLHF